MELRLKIEDVFTIAGRGVVVTGTVQGGALAVGDKVVVDTGGRRVETSVAGIMQGRRLVQRAGPGQQIGLQFANRNLRPNSGDFILVAGAVPDPADPDEPDDPGTPPAPKIGDLKFLHAAGDAPLLLLPLRLETAFVRDRLKLRAYPDSLHVVAEGAAISAAEQQLAVDYLQGVADGQPETALRGVLDRALGPGRADYVLNVVRRGTAQITDAPVADQRPVARGLPARLMAVGWRGGSVVLAGQGKPIPQELPVGPAAGDADLLKTGRNPVAWLSDFDAALQVGMALDLPAGAAPLDRLIVFGLAHGAATDAATLAALLDQHGRSGAGITSPRPGTPTKGGRPPVTAPTDMRAGKRLATALGLSADPLRTPATGSDDLRREMADLIWESAVRPAVTTMFDPDPALAAGEETRPMAAMKARFVDLRPDGQLPLVQVGDDPFGIVIADASVPRASGVDPLAAINATRSDQAAQARRVQRAESALPGYEPGLMALARHDHGQLWRARSFLPADQVLDLLANMSRRAQSQSAVTLTAANDARAALIAAAGGQVGPDAAAHAGSFSGIAMRLCGDLVAPDAPTSTAATLECPHLDALLAGEDLWRRLELRAAGRAAPHDVPGPVPLLAVLVEQAITRSLAELEAAHDGADLEKRAKRLNHGRWLIESPAGLAELARRGADRFGRGALADIARRAQSAQQGPVRAQRLLAALPQWLDRVQAAPPAVVHRVIAGLLDAMSHRPDIWSEAAAADTLFARRKAGDTSLVLGGFGVIEGPIAPRDGDRRKVQHVVAPSASLATVLAALWRARIGLDWHDPGADSLLPADLSARAVSAARPLLETLRRGDDLAHALAARVVDHLQRAGASGLQAELITRYPAPRGEDTPALDAFDGVAFLDDAGLRNWPGAPDVVRGAHAALVDATQGLRMLVVAEGAAALTEGRPDAAQAVLANLAMGAAPPNDLAVTEPRLAGPSVSLAVALAAPWRENRRAGSSLRALLCPELAELAARLLGPIAGHVEGEGGLRLSLRRLAGTPLDLAWRMAPGADGRADLLALARAQGGLDPDTDIAFDQQAEDTLWAASRVHAALSGARALTPADLGQPVPDDWQENARLTALARARSVITKWRNQSRRLLNRFPDLGRRPDPFDRRLRRFPRSLSMILRGLNQPQGKKGLQTLERDLTDRLTAAQNAETTEAALAALLKDMPALLPVTLANPAAFDTRTRLKHAGPAALLHWIEESAAVRDRLEPLADLASMQAGDLPAVAVQWGDTPPEPAQPDTDWLGGPLTEDDVYHARASAVVIGDMPTRGRDPACGLFIDGWVETLPALRGELGVVFDVDAPKARAPQTCLLAVRPARDDWRPDNLADLLTGLMDQAQARMLAPSDWPGRGPTQPPAADLGATLPLLWVEDDLGDLDAALCPPQAEPER